MTIEKIERTSYVYICPKGHRTSVSDPDATLKQCWTCGREEQLAAAQKVWSERLVGAKVVLAEVCEVVYPSISIERCAFSRILLRGKDGTAWEIDIDQGYDGEASKLRVIPELVKDAYGVWVPNPRGMP